MKYDLHIHSTLSDGKKTKLEILELAKEEKLEIISFTDHNTYSEFKSKTQDIIVLPGIEFDCFYKSSFHLLCYFNNFDDNIKSLIKLYSDNMNERSEQLIKNIKNIYNIDFSLELLQKFFNKESISKREIIDWLIFNDYASDVKMAANLYTNKNSQSYVQKYSLDYKKVVSDLDKQNAKIILAHPNKIVCDDIRKFIEELISNGLDGIEVMNTSKMNYEEMQFFQNIAENQNVYMSCGSDLHNKENFGIDNELSEKLIRRLIN